MHLLLHSALCILHSPLATHILHRFSATLTIVDTSRSYDQPTWPAMMTRSLSSGLSPGNGLTSRKYGTPPRTRKSMRATSLQPSTRKAVRAEPASASSVEGGNCGGHWYVTFLRKSRLISRL